MAWAKPNRIARIHVLANAAHAEDSDRLQGGTELILIFLMAVSSWSLSEYFTGRDCGRS
jgi:hypothetical protein